MAAKTGTYTLIGSATVGTTGNNVTLSSIPSVYTDLILVMYARRGIDGFGGDALKFQLNSDTGSNYSLTEISGNGSSAVTGRVTSGTNGFCGTANDGNYATSIAHFMDYSNTTTYKSILSRRGGFSDQPVTANVNLWRSTSAISSIYLYATNGFYSGSTFKLYGIEAAK